MATTKIINTRVEVFPGMVIEPTFIQLKFLIKVIEEAEVKNWYKKETPLVDILESPELPLLLITILLLTQASQTYALKNPHDARRATEITTLAELYLRAKLALKKNAEAYGDN